MRSVPHPSTKWQNPVAAVVLAALNLAICWRLFKAEYTTHFSSIEGSFIAIARYISRHWGDFSWWPLWHCGMPYQDTYVPLLHLVVAGATSLGHISAARAYHGVLGVTYALGPVALYFLAVRLGAHRGAAFLGALVYSLFSPSALLMPEIARDIGGLWYDRRLQVLTVYGEGPHISAMTIIPIAILALENALAKRSGRALALAAVSIALVFLTNVPGTMALGLTVFCWICAQPAGARRPAWIVAALASLFAYGLACYGLPPSSLRAVLGNTGAMHPGYANSLRYGPLPLMLVFAVVAAVGYLLARTRVPLAARFAILYFGLIAALATKANYQTFELLPQVGRLHLEMEIGACLLLGMAGWMVYTRIPRRIKPVILALSLVPIAIQFRHYRSHAHADIHYADLAKRSEYTTARWLDRNLPGRRVYAAGSTSFWLNAFADNPQVVGCCDQSQSMPVLIDIPSFISSATGPRDTEMAATWLRALGAQALVVNGNQSTDEYKDIESPQRFERLFTTLHHENGDTIYSVQPRDASLAHVLRPGEQVPFGQSPVDTAAVARYVDAIGNTARPPAAFEWIHGGTARIRTSLDRQDLVSVQVAWFPGWKAWVTCATGIPACVGRQRPIAPDGLGFMVIQPECQGNCEITLEWTGRPDMPFAAGVSVAAIAFAAFLLYKGKPFSFAWLPAPRFRFRRVKMIGHGQIHLKAPFQLSPRKKILLDFLLLFLFAAVLIRPFFKSKYADKWGSIESTFISDARFLVQHWPHPQWQPLWYGGTRFDYVYPPALRYGTAVISKVTGFWPVKAYHFYAAVFYCLGIAGVYLLVRVATSSRGMAWLCALAAALLSPSFLFMANMRNDAWKRLPVRLGVLAKYGEGPHMSAFALIPIALAFTWIALEKRSLAALAGAAVLCAAVVSTNFYGATALAVFYPILVWSFWITRQDKRIVLPAIVIPVLSYGLTAFWLVPSYFKVTAENMKYVSEHGTTWSIWVAVGVAIAYAIASDRFARGKPQRTWAVFATGCAVFFSLNVLGNHYFNFRISGEPSRLVPELDLVLILSVATVLGWLWNRPGRVPRAVAAIVVAASFYSAAGYVRYAWQMFPLYPNYQDRIEYKIQDWLWKNMPEARTLPSGSVRFWFDAWHDLPQIGGGSDQGILNPASEQAQWDINLAPTHEASILWMQCLGVDAAYVSDKNSQEMFKDYTYPQKFDGVLEVLYDDHAGNKIFRIPRRYPPLVRVVETQRLNAAGRPRFNDDVEYLQAYADVIEKGPDSPATLTWEGTDAMRVHARFDAGQSLVVQESYDPAWHAWSAGQPLAIRKDALGMMAIDPPSGDQEISLAFLTPLENQVGRVVTALSTLAILALIALGIRKERA